MMTRSNDRTIGAYSIQILGPVDEIRDALDDDIALFSVAVLALETFVIELEDCAAVFGPEVFEPAR